MSFFGSLLSGLGSIATGLFGNKASPAANPAAGGSPMMPSQVPVAPQAQNPRPLSGQFLDGLKQVMPNAGSALASYATAGLQGKAVKKFNDSAYPGTTPWEQLGAGADGGSMVDLGTKADEMRQREKESQRVQETALAQSRMQAASLVAGELLKNGGNASLAGAERVLMSSGVLSPAGFGVDPRSLSADRVRAEIGALQSRAYADYTQSEYTSGPLSDQARGAARLSNRQADRVTSEELLNDALRGKAVSEQERMKLEGVLNTMRLALDEFQTLNSGKIGQELRGVGNLASDWFGSLVRMVGLSGNSEEDFGALTGKVMRALEHEVGSGSGEIFKRILEEHQKP